MKILHTADWHFGKQLHKHSLREDMALFLNWLYKIIDSEAIDVLLISGDIFDVSSPSNADREQYYQFLKTIRDLEIITIITGGNHDSIHHLNAPKEYFLQDKIFVIGGATEKLEDEIIPLEINQERVVICAVPFLRDKDLRTISPDNENISREQEIKSGLEKHYQNLLALAKLNHPNCVVVGMGHLFAIGSSTSESERDIHIGNAGAVQAEIFSGYDYIALGHIHKPQIIQKNNFIRYSGSPIALSFSEKKDEKQVLIVEINNGKIKPPKSIAVPKFRLLIRLSDSLINLKNKLDSFENSSKLPAFIELEVKEVDYDLDIIYQTNVFIDEFNSNNESKIITSRFSFKNKTLDHTELFERGTSIKDLNTLEVFEKCVAVNYKSENTEKIKLLKDTFTELLDIYHNNNDEL